MSTKPLHLFCILLGCTPKGRNTEQHDVMFAVASNIEELYAEMKLFWYKPIVEDIVQVLKKSIPGLDSKALSNELLAKWSTRDKVHIDAWMKVEYVDGCKVVIAPKSNTTSNSAKLYFVNLGGYKEGEFEEFHKKMFVVANSVTDVAAKLRHHPFMKEHTPQALGTKAKAHFDDKHHIQFEADDIVCVQDIVGYNIQLVPGAKYMENETMIGYVPLQYK